MTRDECFIKNCWLTILQVSSLFKDGTIGTDINVVVVSLLLLEQDPVSTEMLSWLFKGKVSTKALILLDFAGGFDH